MVVNDFLYEYSFNKYLAKSIKVNQIYNNNLIIRINMQQANTYNKRTQFRLQIRRKQVQAIFAQKRKLYTAEDTYHNLQQLYSDPANSNLILKSLTKDCLIPQLPILLPSLYHKLINNLTIPNVQFVLSVSSNILRDHIQVQQKQYIYNYCMQGLQAVSPKNISPLVEVYFYETVMAACYFCFDQPQQIQIQQKIINRLIELLKTKNIDMSRIPSGYSPSQCRLQIIQQILSSFVYYYQSQNNHNTVLLYKVKRTSPKIKQLINWSKQQLKQLQLQYNFIKILQLFNTIVNNIVEISFSIYTILGYQSFNSLLAILLQQFHYQSQKLEQVKILAAHSIISLLEDQPKLVLEQLTEDVIKIMLNQLQNCVNAQYLLSVAKIFNQIINYCANTQITISNQFDHLLACLLSIMVNILSWRQQETEGKLMKQSLILIRSILSKGFDEGSSEYANHLLNIGGQRLMDNLYVRSHDRQLFEIIDGIFMFIDIC